MCGGIAVFVLAWSLPQQASAFFGFFSHTRAAENSDVLIHDSKLALLDAATNIDPNPSKGGIDIGVSQGSALVPSSGPEGALPESMGIGGPVSDAISLYQVREGDSLSEIADMFGVTANTILWANDIKDAKTIHPGDTLLILPVSGVRYTVKSGGTLKDVAKLFDADIDEIALFNGIDPTAALAAGTEIIIPGGNLAPKPVVKTATKSAGTSVVSKALPALTGYYGNPVPGARLTQGIHGNNGIDLGAPSGTPVYAAAAGTVIVAKNDGGYNGGYGNYIVVSHANGTQTLYAHLSSVNISVGQAVEKGAKIGGVGSTGRSTGNHLHFEVRGAANPFSN